MVLFKESFWKLLDHIYLQSSFSTIMRHSDNSILKDTVQLKILRRWINIRVNSFIKTEKTSWNKNRKLNRNAWKVISCRKIRACASKNVSAKIDHISPIFILFFFSKTKLVLKFNSVLVGILDNFGHNLFTCLPSDYHLLFHWSWSSSSASINFLVRTTTKILLDRRYDELLSIYSRFVGMTI